MNFGSRTKETEARAIAEIFAECMSPDLRCELDTANLYARGESERIVGRIVASNPARFRVATKVGLDRKGGVPEGLSRAAIRESVGRSLERLKMPRVHTLYLHAPDRATPPRETVETLAELHNEGLFECWGVSNFASWRALELMAIAHEVNLPGPARSQVVDNLLARGIEVEHLDFCAQTSIESVAYNPLAGGLLAGTVRPGEPPREGRFHKNALYSDRYLHASAFAAVGDYDRLAAQYGQTTLTLAYRFLVHHRAHGTVLLGPSRGEHVNAAFEAAKEPLDPATLEALEELATSHVPARAPYAR
jgi:aryl-alcohol dehydrogenase-like predicted oxidoreductase